MADEIQDTLTIIAAPYQKLPGTIDRFDTLVGEVQGYLNGLQSPNNSAAQRIDSYIVDPFKGNTPDLMAAGVFVIITIVRILSSMDSIMFITTIAANAVTTTQQAA